MDRINAERKTYKGKSMKPGGGGRFAKGAAKGMPKEMAKWSAAGRKRA